MFFYRRKINLIFILFVLANTTAVKAETIVGTLTKTVITENIAPSCDIQVPKEISLGTLYNGTKKHSPFELSVTCKNNTKTAFVASVVKGNLSGTDTVIMSNGSLLYLQDNKNSNIKLQGKDTEFFCLGSTSGTRSCELTPITEVHSSDKIGQTEAILNFKIIYP